MRARTISSRRHRGLVALALLWVQLPALALLASPAAAVPGVLDTTFDTDGKAITDIGASTVDGGSDVALQADGKIVVAGDSANDFAVVRYDASGSLDTSFDTDGKVTTDVGAASADSGSAVAIQPDGKILVAGTANSGGLDFAVVRYNANGSLDTTFDTDGKVTTDIGTASTDSVNALAVQANGKIVVVGNTSSGGGDFATVRYNADGSLDTTFDTDGKVITDVGFLTFDLAFDVAIQPDGRLVVGGQTSAGNGNVAVVRYNTDGSLDPTFDTDGKLMTDIGGASEDAALDIALQPDGKIVAAGFSNPAGNLDIAVLRYSASGSLDATFDNDGKITTDIGAATVDFATSIVVQADGKLVAAGTSATDFVLVRYSAVGTVDAGFSGDGKVLTNFSSGSNDKANAVVQQADGRLLAAGSTTSGGGGDIAVSRYLGDPAVTVAVGDASATETDASTVNAVFNVTLSGAATEATSVSYATANGTATAPGDYTSTAGVVTFAPGETLKTVTVPILPDGTDEPNETFFVNLSNPSGDASVQDAQGAGIIIDDDGDPGYWMVASDGGVFAFNVPFSGSTGSITLNKPMVGMAADPDGKGYWLVASDGGIFAFDAGFFGSTGALKLNKPVVGMTATPTGKGYYLVASDGGIFAFGDAVFKGSTGALTLNKPIVGMAADPDGSGYFLVASDGGVFAFDAVFKGSTGAIKLKKPMVGMAADPDGRGYFLVASDGGVFAFDAIFKGSTGAIRLNMSVVGMAADSDGTGYYLVASDGGVFAFDAPFKGSTGAIKLNKPVVGMAVNT